MEGAEGTLRVRLFGNARFVAHGEAIKFARRGSIVSLLAYLIVARAAIAREPLAFTLFPELDERGALAELRRHLYLAQKALPAGIEWLVVENDTIRWNHLAPAWIDVIAFAGAAANDDAALAAAIDLYTGDLLPEIYEEWVVAPRERLRSQYLAALGSLIVSARSRRAYPAAIAFARRLLTTEPLREDVVRHLMSAQYESGDAMGALGEFERFARLARDELRVEPMPDTRALRDAIAAGRALASSLDRANESPIERPAQLPFYGRAKPIERIRNAWQRAARGRGALVAIEGEPGVGKSRLAAEFSLIAHTEGGRVLVGTTSAPEKVPYQSIVDALRAAMPFMSSTQNALRRAVLATVLPELAIPADRTSVPKVEPDREQDRLFEAICSAFAEIARVRPVCLVLEDLHWAGPATLQLLATLARRAATAPILILGTFRDEDVSPDHALRALLRDLASERIVTRMPIDRLTRDDVEVLVGMTAAARATTLDAASLYESSEGNPLFLHEAIAEAVESGNALPAAPSRVSSVIARRLERLSSDAYRLAQIAAICGNAFDADVVCLAAGKNDARGLSLFDELLERHVVREAGIPGGFDFVFSHHLVATVLVDRLDPAERAKRHLRAAHALERVHAARLDTIASELGRHYAAADQGELAALWYARAANVAAGVFAHDEAVRFATLALAATTEPVATRELLRTREEANARLGRTSQREADLERLERLAATSADRCEALRRRLEHLRSLEDRVCERETIAALRRAATDTDDRRWLGVADCAEALLEISIGRFAVARPLAESALAHATASGCSGDRMESLCALIEIDVATGRRASAEALLEIADALAQETGDRAAVARSLMQTVAFAISQQDFDRVAESAERAAAIYRTLGDRLGEARALANLAAASLRRSRWDVARRANLAALRTFELARDGRGLARTAMNLGMLHGRCGDFEEARRYLRRARVAQERSGDERAVTASLLNESFLAIWQGEPTAARELATSALALATKMEHSGYVASALGNLGAAERDLGRLETAIELMDRGLSLQLALERLPDAASDIVDAALGYAYCGDLERAGAYVERLLTFDRASIEASVYPPYPPWIAARILHARGDARAPEMLGRAARSAHAFAASIDVPELRATFSDLRFVREIADAAERDAWPPLEPPSARHANGTPAP